MTSTCRMLGPPFCLAIAATLPLIHWIESHRAWPGTSLVEARVIMHRSQTPPTTRKANDLPAWQGSALTLRELLIVSGLCLTLVTACFAAERAADDRGRRPNVLVIVTDDQRADAMGCAGNPHIRTPNMDALAGTGMRFLNAFVTTSICSPSRAALLTGRYGSANGVGGLANPTLKPGEKTWPQVLKTAGYRTALVGKWHLKNPPESVGFDNVTSFESNGPYYGRQVIELGQQKQVDGFIDDYVADQAVRFLRDAVAAETPFALLVCTQSPHLDPDFRWPARPDTRRTYETVAPALPVSWEDDLAGKPAYLKQSRHRTRAVDDYGYDRKEKVLTHIRDYYAAITDMDAAVGRIVKAIDELGERSRTYIVFTSDNGWFLGEHRFTSKVLAYEESIRVPLMIAGPGVRPGTDTRLVLNIDIAPTLLDLAAVPKPDGLHGRSLATVIREGAPGRDSPWRKSMFYEATEPELGSWPLVALRTDRHKYILTYGHPSQPPQPAFEELYDLAADPAELKNLAPDPRHTPILQDMRTELVRSRAAIREVDAVNRLLRIDADFPGGNIIVDRLDGDRVFLRQDLRDTPRWWFYWCFRVRGAGGRSLTFEFTDGNPIGRVGPACSKDGGRTWSWLGAEAVVGASFTFNFPEKADDVRFAFTIPYQASDLQAFLEPLRGDPCLNVGSLCRTQKGRDVEVLHAGRIDGKAEHRVLVTARHHACESMASFVLEGLVLAVVKDEEQQWLREHVEFMVVPFVDKDGVEQGDQGKLRAPHDPNRDYDGTSIYPSVAALRDRVPAWADGRLKIALDLHCPYIRGRRDETIFFVGQSDERIWQNTERLAGLLESLPVVGLPYHTKDNLPFGQEWNTRARLGEGRSMAGWAAQIPGIDLACTIEVPYAVASASTVTPDSAREFGRNLCRAIRLFLKRE